MAFFRQAIADTLKDRDQLLPLIHPVCIIVLDQKVLPESTKEVFHLRVIGELPYLAILRLFFQKRKQTWKNNVACKIEIFETKRKCKRIKTRYLFNQQFRWNLSICYGRRFRVSFCLFLKSNDFNPPSSLSFARRVCLYSNYECKICSICLIAIPTYLSLFCSSSKYVSLSFIPPVILSLINEIKMPALNDENIFQSSVIWVGLSDFGIRTKNVYAFGNFNSDIVTKTKATSKNTRQCVASS